SFEDTPAVAAHRSHACHLGSDRTKWPATVPQRRRNSPSASLDSDREAGAEPGFHREQPAPAPLANPCMTLAPLSKAHEPDKADRWGAPGGAPLFPFRQAPSTLRLLSDGEPGEAWGEGCGTACWGPSRSEMTGGPSRYDPANSG